MYNFKTKILSLVLVLAMLISGSSLVFASEFKDVTGDYESAINLLTSLGVIDGYEDSTFRPDRTITRGEMVKILVETLGYGSLTTGAESKFKDMKGHWSENCVAFANEVGLVAGYPDGTFKPDATISYDEAYAMVIRALGYTDEVLKGSWPLKYRIKASELNLMTNVAMVTYGADRGGVAQVIFNALESKLVTVMGNNSVSYVLKSDGKTAKTFLDNLCDYEENYIVTPETLNKDSKNYGGNLVDLSSYIYQTLKVYLNEDKEVIYVKDSNSSVVGGIISSTSEEPGILKIEDKNGKLVRIPMSDSVSLFYNGAEISNYDMKNLYLKNKLPNAAFEKIVVVSKGAKIEKSSDIAGIIIEQQTKSAVIENVYKSGRTKFDIFSLPLTSTGSVDLTKVLVAGSVSDIEDIKKGDVVVSYEAEGTKFVKLVVSRNNTVDGKITRVSSSNEEFTVNNKAYNVNITSSEVYNKGTKSALLKLGDSGTFYLDKDNKIVGISVETVLRENYGVIIGTASGVVTNGAFDYEVTKYPAIKIATENNKNQVFEIYVKVNSNNGTLYDSAQYDTSLSSVEKDLLVISDTAINFVSDISSEIAKGQVVKYSVNKDGKIDSITLVSEDTMSNLNTTSKGFILARNAAIFENDGSTYPIVSQDYLDNYISGKVVFNNNGEIEVLLVNSDDIRVSVENTLVGYLESTNHIGMGYNNKGDIVQIPMLYVNGVEKEFYAASNNTIKDGKGAYILEFDSNNVIIKATKVSLVNATVASINSKGTLLRLTIGDKTEWYSVSSNATMLEFNSNGNIRFIETYDLDEGMEIKVVLEDDTLSYIELITE